MDGRMVTLPGNIKVSASNISHYIITCNECRKEIPYTQQQFDEFFELRATALFSAEIMGLFEHFILYKVENHYSENHPEILAMRILADNEDAKGLFTLNIVWKEPKGLTPI